MKIRFLGTGGAFSRISENYHNNALIEMDDGYRLLIDCGSTALESLSCMEGFEQAPHKVDGIIITHIHADHVGGLEEMAFRNYFLENQRKVDLFVPPSLLPSVTGNKGDGTDLWENCLKGGLQHVQNFNNEPINATIDTYFNVHTDWEFEIRESIFKFFPTEHVQGKKTYGLIIENQDKDRTFDCILYTADSKVLISDLYEVADLIFHDCSFSPKYPSTVHSHFEELSEFPLEYREKMKLMHYGDANNQPLDLREMELVEPHRSYVL